MQEELILKFGSKPELPYAIEEAVNRLRINISFLGKDVRKIMVASSKGNVRIPPKTSSRDYSGLFYGTMPAPWKEVFEGGRLLPVSEWEHRLTEAIETEERYENLSRDLNLSAENAEGSPEPEESLPSKKTVLGLFVILRGERTNSLEMSRLLYETQDLLELEQEHGHFRLIQGFVYGDGVVRQKDLDEHPIGFRLQIPHRIREYSKVEALLIGCEWMMDLCRDITREGVDCQCRLYVLSDGRIENNEIYKACLAKISRLMACTRFSTSLPPKVSIRFQRFDASRPM